MKIPLFDIDGTLFKTANPVHKNAFAYAFNKVYGVDAKQTEIRPEGMVDNQIIIEVLKLHGLSETEIKVNKKNQRQQPAQNFITSGSNRQGITLSDSSKDETPCGSHDNTRPSAVAWKLGRWPMASGSSGVTFTEIPKS